MRESEAQKVPALAEKTGKKPKIGYEIIKRAGDVVLSLVASVILLLPMLVLGLLIVIKDPGDPLYFHKRVGKNGKEIKIAKFRTMRKGADDLEKMLTPAQLAEYRREYQSDEDPWLFLSSDLQKKYTSKQQALLLSVRPGLTGCWQAYARNEA